MQSSEPETSDGIGEMICGLERIRTTALVQRDLPTIERLHAPDYELITPSRRVYDRRAYIGAIASEPFYLAARPDASPPVRYDGAAKVSGTDQVSFRARRRVLAHRHLPVAFRLMAGRLVAGYRIAIAESIFAEASDADPQA